MDDRLIKLKDLDVVIVGLGTMGGSLAGALKAKHVFSQVLGFDVLTLSRLTTLWRMMKLTPRQMVSRKRY